MAGDFDLKVVLGIGVVVVFFLTVFLFGKVMKQAGEREQAIKSYVSALEVERKAQKQANEELLAAKDGLDELNSSLEQAFESLQHSAEEAELRAMEIEGKSAELQRLTEESDTIFNSIDNGVCLLGPDYKIGNKISLAMYEIFETDTLAGVSFVSLMKPLISEKELRTLSDFLELLFEGKTLTKQLDKFNPLKKVEITLNWNGEKFSAKQLGFKFQRIMDGNEVGAVLVSVTDLTESVILEKELKKNVEEQERQTVVIIEILNSDYSKLDPFILDAESEVEIINATLKDLGSKSGGVPGETVDEIYRKIHKIKGDASLLKLQSVVDLAHSIESQLSELRGSGDLTGDKLLGALMHLASLKTQLVTYKNVSASIFQEFVRKPVINDSLETEACEYSLQLSEFARENAAVVGKKVNVITDITMDDLSEEQIATLMSVITQSIRNSIAHGIERPMERLKAGKIEAGLITVVCRPSIEFPDQYELSVRDDGAGLDLASIKQRAVELEMISKEEAASMSGSEAVNLIFKSGFSTTEEETNLSGRGMGMDVIKHTVNDTLGGKLNMAFSKGHYMLLKCEFPVSKTANVLEEVI
ncbi:ATP-binding protein [Rubritalea spongiae]